MAVLENGGKAVKTYIYYNQEKKNWDLTISGGIGGQAVNEGAVLGGRL